MRTTHLQEPRLDKNSEKKGNVIVDNAQPMWHLVLVNGVELLCSRLMGAVVDRQATAVKKRRGP